MASKEYERHTVSAAAAEQLRRAVEAAQDIARTSNFDGCDLEDIEDVVATIWRELAKVRPNAQTLSTYVNSLARSLRAYAPARTACLQLDAAMRAAGLTADWEN